MPKQPSLSQIRAAFSRLTLEQAKEFQRELEQVIQELEQQRESFVPPLKKGREVVQVQRVEHSDETGKTTRLYQLELIRCGKAACKCAGENGELHGPYWYAYWREDGKLKSRYIGKKLDLNK